MLFIPAKLFRNLEVLPPVWFKYTVKGRNPMATNQKGVNNAILFPNCITQAEIIGLIFVKCKYNSI